MCMWMNDNHGYNQDHDDDNNHDNCDDNVENDKKNKDFENCTQVSCLLLLEAAKS